MKHLNCLDNVREAFGKMTEKLRNIVKKECGNQNNENKDFRSKCNSFCGKCYDSRYKVFKCPQCKQKLRVPRGKGKIMITCRRCQFEFVKRT